MSVLFLFFFSSLSFLAHSMILKVFLHFADSEAIMSAFIRHGGISALLSASVRSEDTRLLTVVVSMCAALASQEVEVVR